jgi:hypothetical protein
MSITSDTESGIKIPGTSSDFLDPAGPGDRGHLPQGVRFAPVIFWLRNIGRNSILGLIA